MYGKLFWIDLRGAINGYAWFITDISSCLGIKLALSIILKHSSSESVINFLWFLVNILFRNTCHIPFDTNKWLTEMK